MRLYGLLCLNCLFVADPLFGAAVLHLILALECATLVLCIGLSLVLSCAETSVVVTAQALVGGGDEGVPTKAIRSINLLIDDENCLP